MEKKNKTGEEEKGRDKMGRGRREGIGWGRRTRRESRYMVPNGDAWGRCRVDNFLLLPI